MPLGNENGGNGMVELKTQNLFEWEKKRAERQNVQLTQEQAQIFEQQREQREQRHQQRSAYFQENCTVLMPEENIEVRTFNQLPAEQISTGKRKVKSKLLGSALRRKRVNAEDIEKAAANQEELLKKKAQQAGGFGDGVGLKEQHSLSNFLTGDQISDQAILQGMKTADGGVNGVAVQACYRQFMAIDLKNMDFRTDKKIAANAARLEEIAGKVAAMNKLLAQYPAMRDSLSKDEEEDLDLKLAHANDIVNLYRIKKKIIANPYYKTHYQSEISDQYHKDMPAEAQQLTMLLWQAERLMSGKTLDESHKKYQFLLNYQRRMTVQEQNEAEADRAVLAQKPMGIYQPEYGKNDTEIEDSRHAEYFRLHDHEGDPIYDRLKAHSYQVTGEPTAMTESFVRHISNLPRWKAVQNMEAADVRQMVEDLAAAPVHADQAEEVAQCRQRNLNGMRTFKDLVKKQMNYLKRKYGGGFMLMTPEQMRDHVEEFQNDFTNMQGLSEFMTYLKKIPGMFDSEDDSDVEADRLLTYYQSMAMSEGMAKSFYMQNVDGVNSYSAYKQNAASISMMSKYQEVKDAMLDTDLEQTEVKWDTHFFETAEDLAAQINSPWLAPTLTKIKEQRGNLNNFTWNLLFDEYKQMDATDAADLLMRREWGADIEQKTEEWKTEGLTFGAITVPGIGTDDFVTLRNIYREVRDNEAIRADYGVDTPAKLEEYKQKLQRLEDMSVFLHQKEYEADRALELRDRMRIRAGAAGSDSAKRILRNLVNSFDQVGDRYIDAMSAYKRGEGDAIYNEFAQLRERLDMWHYPEHRAIFHETLEPEMERMQPESQVVIGGVTVPVYERAQLFAPGVTRLKEGVTPEDFQEAVQAFNQEFARCDVLRRIFVAGETEDGQEAEPLWHAVTRKKAFFQYDVANRQSTSYERLMALKDKINGMTE